MAILKAGNRILNFGSGVERAVAFAEDRVQQATENTISVYTSPNGVSDPLTGGLVAVVGGGSSKANTFSIYSINDFVFRSPSAYIQNVYSQTYLMTELRNCYYTRQRIISKDRSTVINIGGDNDTNAPTPVPDGRAFITPRATATINELIVNEDLTYSKRSIGTLSAGGFFRLYYHVRTNALYAFGEGKTQMLRISIGKRNDLANYPDVVSLISGVLNRNGAAAIARRKVGEPIYAAPMPGGRFMEITFDANGVPAFNEFGPTVPYSYDLLVYTNKGFIYCFGGHFTQGLKSDIQPLVEINTNTNTVRFLNNITRVAYAVQNTTGDLVFQDGYNAANSNRAKVYKVIEAGLNENNPNLSHELFYGFNVATSGS